MILNSLLKTLYYIGLTGYYGQTFGKMILKLKILNTDGTEISYGTAFLRYCAYILSIIPFCLGFIIVGFRSDKRGFHDILVGTKVIHL